jgi:hypothetical protein
VVLLSSHPLSSNNASVRRTAGFAVVVIAALAACSDSAEGVEATGTITLVYDVDPMLEEPARYARENSDCPHGYGDGTRVVVTNEAGDTIKTFDLRGGVNALPGCDMSFDTSLPEADFYTFTIRDGPNADEKTFSREEVEGGINFLMG